METKFIADVGSNHNGSISRALKFVSLARDIGCWGVKFQYYKSEKLWSDPSRVDEARYGEIAYPALIKASENARHYSIKFGCSVFHPEDVTKIARISDFLKISSFECLHQELIESCRSTGLQTFISYGVVPPEAHPGFADAFYCVSRYPARPEECNLDMMSFFDFSGYSDHSADPGVIYAAVENSAEYIEFHLDIDGEGNEYKHGHCWLPEDICPVIDAVRNWELARGFMATRVYSSREDLKPLMWNPETGKRGQ